MSAAFSPSVDRPGLGLSAEESFQHMCGVQSR